MKNNNFVLNFVLLTFIMISGFSQKLTVPADLQAHNSELKKEVVKVTNGVWCAVGYALAAVFAENNNPMVICHEDLEKSISLIAGLIN